MKPVFHIAARDPRGRMSVWHVEEDNLEAARAMVATEISTPDSLRPATVLALVPKEPKE